MASTRLMVQCKCIFSVANTMFYNWRTTNPILIRFIYIDRVLKFVIFKIKFYWVIKLNILILYYSIWINKTATFTKKNSKYNLYSSLLDRIHEQMKTVFNTTQRKAVRNKIWKHVQTNKLSYRWLTKFKLCMRIM